MLDLFATETAPQAALDFPIRFTEKYRPHSIAQFVGLDKPKKLCLNLAARPVSDAFIFKGPSGTGKTTMALALAELMPAEIHHVPSQECNLETIERVRRTCQYVPMAGCKMHLVLVDEADRMTSAAQISLLSKLDSTNFPPNTMFIFTCNATDGLEPRFLSRCKQVEFSSYGIAKDAAELLADVWSKEAPAGAPAPNFARIVKEANNNVREAMNTLETELLYL